MSSLFSSWSSVQGKALHQEADCTLQVLPLGSSCELLPTYCRVVTWVGLCRHKRTSRHLKRLKNIQTAGTGKASGKTVGQKLKRSGWLVVLEEQYIYQCCSWNPQTQLCYVAALQIWYLHAEVENSKAGPPRRMGVNPSRTGCSATQRSVLCKLQPFWRR